jgi:hypothetical protein
VVGEKKKERQWGTWVVGKKKGNKKEKRNGEWGLLGKKGKWKGKKKKKKLKEKKLNWFYLYVHFVWCKV